MPTTACPHCGAAINPPDIPRCPGCGRSLTILHYGGTRSRSCAMVPVPRRAEPVRRVPPPQPPPPPPPFVVAPPPPPPSAADVPRQRHLSGWALFAAVMVSSFVIGVVLIAAANAITSPHLIHEALLWPGNICACAPIIVFFLAVFLAQGKVFNDSVKAAGRGLQPVPPPLEIAAQLQVELGRPPTLAEVADAQRILATARNQDLVTAGIGFALLRQWSNLDQRRR